MCLAPFNAIWNFAFRTVVCKAVRLPAALGVPCGATTHAISDFSHASTFSLGACLHSVSAESRALTDPWPP